MLQNSTSRLLTTINNNNSSNEELNNAFGDFLNAFRESNESEQAVALYELCISLDSITSQFVGVLANFIGYLFEAGYKPDAAIQPLISFFERLLVAGLEVTKSFEKKIEALPPDVTEDDDFDIYETFDEHFGEYSQQNPAVARFWMKLEETWCCGIAMLSVSKEARKQARRLRPLAKKNSDFGQGAHWLNVMLSVFDDEPFIAIDLDKQTGVMGKMSGIVENFQLQTLLMDAFPAGWFSSGNLAPEIIRNAKGFGEQTLNVGVKGRWNMYDWTIVSPEINLTDCTDRKFSKHWIWGEGKPEDIPVFESQRVILLGKPSYERNWTAQRMFSNLKAELKVEQKLSKAEVGEMLRRMAAAPKPVNPFES